jgi:hypothetical protein
MIFAIEGPDGVGKSSTVNGLRPLFPDAHFIQFRNVPAVFYAHIGELEPVLFQLFQQMYDPARIYISDRFFSVSSRVYSKLYQRDYTLLDTWVMPELHVIRLRCAIATLCQRRPDEQSIALLDQIYSDVCANLTCATSQVIDSEDGSDETVQQVAEIIRKSVNDAYARAEWPTVSPSDRRLGLQERHCIEVGRVVSIESPAM